MELQTFTQGTIPCGEGAGFIEDHTTGSYIIFYHSKTGNRAVVPYHLKDIPKGTLLSLIREARVSRDELLHA